MKIQREIIPFLSCGNFWGNFSVWAVWGGGGGAGLGGGPEDLMNGVVFTTVCQGVRCGGVGVGGGEEGVGGGEGGGCPGRG